MDVFSPLIHLALKCLVVLFPMTVVWLSLRRLALSKSANAWIYAVMCVFAAVTSAGILPWALGLSPLNWVILGFALLTPACWIGVVVVCDTRRKTRYGPDRLTETARTIAASSHKKLAPLLLKPADPNEVPAPLFQKIETPSPLPDKPTRSPGTRTILSLARDMRNNASSEQRRPKLLQSTDNRKIPFLKGSSQF